MRRPQTARALREMEAEAKSMSLLMPVKVISRWNGLVTFDRSQGDVSTMTEEDFDLEFVEMKQEGAPDWPLIGNRKPTEAEIELGRTLQPLAAEALARNKERETVAATPEASQELAVPDIEGAAGEYSQLVAAFQSQTARVEGFLKKENITIQDVELAKEFEDPAIAYLKALDDPKSSKLRRWATSLHELHLQVTGRISALSQPAIRLRAVCSELYRARTAQIKAREAEEQRKREAAQAAQIKAEREAEEAALAAQATPEAEEQLAVLKETPLPQPSSPPPRSFAKIQGVSIVYSAGWGEITDAKLFTKWLAEHPDEMAGFEPKMSYWKSKATAHLNKDTGRMSLSIPGLKFSITDGSRRR